MTSSGTPQAHDPQHASPAEPAQEQPVLTARRGACGVITLNRPRAINALNLEMVHLIRQALTAWEHDDEVQVVLLRGAGDRGLCSGGDVRRQRELALGSEEDHAQALRFWADEYELDGMIGTYPKPFVALLDGITMGGGVGLAGHASHRVVTSTSKVAMPEMTIGFFPDVGATHLLVACPGQLGLHLALTGRAAGAADAIHAGLADAYVDTENNPSATDEIESRLASSGVAALGPRGDLGHLLNGLSADPGGSAMAEAADWIDRCYARESPAEMVEALRAESSEAARAAADEIEARSPLAVHIAVRAVRQAAELGELAAVLRRDTALATWFTDEPEFHEGVRAQLVDKDRNPAWRHASLSDVSPEEVDAAFAGIH